MADFLQNCLDGIAIGAAYALLALGFTLIFGVLRRLNLSYGPSIMAGVFAGTALYMAFNAGPVEIAVATVIGAVVVGAYIERLCFWAIRKDMAVASMVSSFVIWMQIEEGVTLLFPDRTYAFPGILADATVEFGPFFLRASQPGDAGHRRHCRAGPSRPHLPDAFRARRPRGIRESRGGAGGGCQLPAW